MKKSAWVVWTLALGGTASGQVSTLASKAWNSPSTGNGGSSDASVTPDGRYVVYLSTASDLVSSDTNGARDAFRFDVVTGTNVRVSVGASASTGNAEHTFLMPPSIAADGGRVAFNSIFPCVTSDTNGHEDVFLRLVADTHTAIVSRSSSGAQGNGRSNCGRSAVSGDGRYVVFDTEASNLVAGDTNGQLDVLVRDVLFAQTTRVSVPVDGVQGNGASFGSAMTPDASYVVFSSFASNLVPGDTNSTVDVFLKNRQTGALERVSLGAGGIQGNAGSEGASVSDDGRYVAFQSLSASFGANGFMQIWVRDRQTSVLELVSVDLSGNPALGTFAGGTHPSISGDGRYVAFRSDAPNLVPGTANGQTHVYVRDRLLATTTRVSVSSTGVQSNGFSSAPMAATGGKVVFGSTASNLWPNDANALGDVFANYLPTPPSNDECSSPQPISGTGTFAVDTDYATTSLEGQSDSGCGPGIGRDVWFSWTATFSGTAEMSLCDPIDWDTKIAVHAGSACPTGAAIVCNDNGCNLRSRVCFPVTAGGSFLLQIGTHVLAPPGFTGTFTISQSAASSSGCAPLDDGGTENAIGVGSPGWLGWVQRFGDLSGTTTVSAVSTVWGSALFPGSAPPNGSQAKVGIWDDPDDDGNLDDAVLLQAADAVVVGSGTDAFQTIAFVTPVQVAGYFFVGAAVAHAGDVYPIPIDEPPTCDGFGRAWGFACNGSCTLDLSTFGNGTFSLNGIGDQWGQVLLRPVCGGSTSFCMPAQAGVIGCPCSNPGQAGRGCDNSDATGGALLGMSGTSSVGSDTLVLSTSDQKASSVSVVLQGTLSNGTGAVFGQGVRCTAGSLKRLYIKNSVGGSISVPGAGDPSVSARSAALGDPLTAGSTRYYQVYYRDPVVLGGCPSSSTFNLTQGQIVTWF